MSEKEHIEYIDLDVETPIRTEKGIWDYNYVTRKYVLRKPKEAS